MELSASVDIITVVISTVAAITVGGLLLSLAVFAFVAIADKISAKYHEKKDLRKRIQLREEEEEGKKTVAKLVQEVGSLTGALKELRGRTDVLEERARELAIAFNIFIRNTALEREKVMDTMNNSKLYQYNVKFNVFDPEQKFPKEYFYFAFKEYEIGDIVMVDTVNGLSLARVSSIASTIPDIPKERIRTIVDKVDYDGWRDKLGAFRS